MTKRMLIDASHPEETRVVVAENTKVSEFDYEIEDKKPLKGNIYLAKVTRVEPSLQAAFVDYGGNRHGFLPFAEIHPDYYRLPVADREALIAEEREAQRAALAESEAGAGGDTAEPDAAAEAAAAGAKQRSSGGSTGAAEGGGDTLAPEPTIEQLETGGSVETLADDDLEEAARRRAAILGRYKIQEVIKRRQVILVQVVKEERGSKGAALSTYLSLAGRYCVLMPNTDKGGGVSRKISNAKDRKRLKTILADLKIPEGMAVIVRTAGSQRTKAEIKRDYDYLLRLWDQIRETTLQSTAPSLIYEEANLIKRSIRDLYTRDMDEVLVQGETGYKAAKGFMRSLMPSHAKKVQRYNDPKLPIFHRFQVEQQLDNIHSPSVQLKSGGYVVINQTEALVAIDVNSGKSTKERHIEETALKTNLEAADEIARQLKLRDLAGLIVIDFIDMDAPRNNKEVEQRLKEAMRQDRARIQLGRISPFGLLELSRQRLRPSVHETSTEVCQTCGGSGFVRSPESTALHVLRALEEEGVKRGGGEVRLTVPGAIAMYVLNEKRARLQEVEQRYGFHVRVDTDDHLIPPAHRLDRISTAPAEPAESEAAPAEAEQPAQTETAEASESAAGKRGRRGGRKKRKTASGSGAEAESVAASAESAGAEETADRAAADGAAQAESETEEESAQAKRRRRGKRGGRRRAKRREDGTLEAETEGSVETDGAAASGGAAADSGSAAQADTASGGTGAAETAAESETEAAGASGGSGAEAASGASGAKSRRSSRSSRKRSTKSRSKIAAAAEETAEHAKAKAKETPRPDGQESSAAPEAEASGSSAGAAANGEEAAPRRRSSSRRSTAGQRKTTSSRSSGTRGRTRRKTTETADSASGGVADSGSAGEAPGEPAGESFGRESDADSGGPASGGEAAVAAAGRGETGSGGGNGAAPPAASGGEAPADVDAANGTAAAPASASGGAAPRPGGAGDSPAIEGPTLTRSAGETPANAGAAPVNGPVTQHVSQAPITPFGEAAEPSGRDEVEPQPETRSKRKGWWQKLLG